MNHNVADIWSILKKEIEERDPEGAANVIVGRSSSNEQNIVRRDPDAVQMKAVLEEMERRGDLFIKGLDDITAREPSYVDPINARIPEKPEQGQVGSLGAEADNTGSEDDHEKGENKMKKSIRIRQNGDQVYVRVFVGDEEFCGMSVATGSNNSISLGGTTVSIQGDETILEI
ncbi:MAG TPA: hypothetical protein PLV56_01800 [Synergistales bacterium]|nr:hypothetical protein [Synergistales bacterium]